MIHLEGMGLLGCLTAVQLCKHRVSFTWHDTDDKINAWQASTGACYPASGEVDHDSWLQWRRWWSNKSYSPHVEQCAYWVDSTHKSLPHGLVADVQAEVGGMRLVGYSVHCNAQSLVQSVREQLRTVRTVGVPKTCTTLIVSHGFSKRRVRYLWGWTRLIRLRYPEEIAKHGRPSFYLRKNRFQFAYCYPRPGTDQWYAGSSLISQTDAKPLAIESKYEGWEQRFMELSGGKVEITDRGEMLQGWRPAKGGSLSQEEGHKAGRPDLLLDETEGGRRTIYFPTLASNGFRHFPEVWRQLQEALAIGSAGFPRLAPTPETVGAQ